MRVSVSMSAISDKRTYRRNHGDGAIDPKLSSPLVVWSLPGSLIQINAQSAPGHKRTLLGWFNVPRSRNCELSASLERGETRIKMHTRRALLRSAVASALTVPSARGVSAFAQAGTATQSGRTVDVDDPQAFSHRFATINGVRLHYVEEGTGPLVLLLHGIPYLWYNWRHQVKPLAAAGYRVVVPDLPGFGQSDAPLDVQRYEVLRVVGDLVGLVQALNETSCIVIGHDLGSRIAAYTAELRPDMFRALVMMASPVGARDARSPNEIWQQIRTQTGKRYYHDYLQTPGLADTQLNVDVRKSLRAMLYSVSANALGSERWRPLVGGGETFLDTFTDPKQLPAWLSAMALDYYVTEYQRHGFTPPLNYYRGLVPNWVETPFLDGLKPRQPSLFIGGADDPTRPFFMATYNQLEAHLPNLQKKVLLAGVGHDPAEEKPEMVTGMLLAFLAAV
jgi:pimeloyl-ACP methyl ester carboxylesterase